MFSIAELLERAKARANIESDYRLAKVIGKSHQVISNYRVGKSLPEESVIEQLCALSGDDPDVIAAQIQAERSKSPEAKTMWLRIAARMSGAASTVILSVLFTISLIALPLDSARAATLDAYKSGSVTILPIVSSTFLSVGHFVMVRLRQITAIFWLCRAPIW